MEGQGKNNKWVQLLLQFMNLIACTNTSLK